MSQWWSYLRSAHTRFEDFCDVKKSTSYEIGQSETRADQLVTLKAVTSRKKFEGAAPRDYCQFHLPLCTTVVRDGLAFRWRRDKGVQY